MYLGHYEITKFIQMSGNDKKNRIREVAKSNNRFTFFSL